MKPAKQMIPPDWMTSPPTRAVMAALNDPGTMQVLFVGGCVRNELLGMPVSDIDLATIHTPDDVMARLQEAGIRHIPTGLAHGTVTAVAKGRTFEITTLRRDVETDGRHAVVAYTHDWREDAQRRDFTMNTLLADMSGNVYDPLEQGLADLRDNRVIFVGDPAHRIAEDYLRILRFFRFHALYGKGEPDPAALIACRNAAPHIVSLSRERVAQEMLKILAAANPADTLTLMFAHNVTPDFRSDNFDQVMFSRFCALQAEYDAPDVMARLSWLAGMDYERAGSLLLLSGAQHRSLRTLILTARDAQRPAENNIRQLIYKYGNDVMGQILLLHMAHNSATPEYRALMETVNTWNPPKFPLAGHDVLALGITPGPALGQLLSDVEAWWLAHDFAPDRDACLRQLQRSVQAPLK